MKSYSEVVIKAIIMIEEIEQSRTDANIISNEPRILRSLDPGVLMNA